jgi:hypothetical protein
MSNLFARDEITKFRVEDHTKLKFYKLIDLRKY